MKTTKQIYEESLAEIKSVDIISDISNKIIEITEALYKKDLQNWSGDQISRAITNLAVLRVNLGQDMVNAVAYADMSYLSRKMTYASEWNPTKQHLTALANKATVQDIESEVAIKIAQIQEDEIKAKHYAEQLRILYGSTETLIMALQSRLGVLKMEKQETRHY